MPDVLQGAGTTLRVALSAHGMRQVGGARSCRLRVQQKAEVVESGWKPLSAALPVDFT